MAHRHSARRAAIRAAIRATAPAVAILALLIPALAMGQDNTPAPRRHSPFLAGQFLIAEPKMGDPRFVETVIYMVNHDASGALGLVINKAYGSGPLDKFLEGFGLDTEGVSGEVRLYYGGPVQPERGFVLHTSDYKGSGKTTILGDVTFTTELQVLRDIGTGNGPKKSLFAFGYAGWGPGQLEGELARDDWVTAPVDVDLLFDASLDDKWQRARAKAGRAL